MTQHFIQQLYAYLTDLSTTDAVNAVDEEQDSGQLHPEWAEYVRIPVLQEATPEFSE